MADKLNHAVAVQALHDICAESENLVNSGDLRVAGEARRDYLLASICLQLLSNVEPDTFTNTELAKLPTPDQLNEGTHTVIDSGPAPAQPVNADQLNQANDDATIVPGNEDVVQDDNTDETTDHLNESDLNNDSATDSKSDSGPDDAAVVTPVNEPVSDTVAEADVVSTDVTNSEETNTANADNATANTTDNTVSQ